ncbi:MAG: carboxypeptidase-like regulatory domain-containing protein, partial [Flavisolibacter sp.]
MSYACVRSITMLLCFTAFSIQVFAQTGKITGQVKDANGQPLAKASVQIQSGSGTSTDDNGYYSLTAPVGKQTLIISFVGYATQKLAINVNENGSNVQDAVMAPTGELGNVTIVGSRSAARTRTETPVPVDVIPLARVLNDVGQVDLNQILTFIAPSFQSS